MNIIFILHALGMASSNIIHQGSFIFFKISSPYRTEKINGSKYQYQYVRTIYFPKQKEWKNGQTVRHLLRITGTITGTVPYCAWLNESNRKLGPIHLHIRSVSYAQSLVWLTLRLTKRKNCSIYETLLSVTIHRNN